MSSGFTASRHMALILASATLPALCAAAQPEQAFRTLDTTAGTAVEAIATPLAAWSGTLVDGQGVFHPLQPVHQSAPIAATSSPPPAYYGQDPAGAPAATASRLEIRLQGLRFDPLHEVPPVVPALAQAPAAIDGPDYRLLQFVAPIRLEWRQELARRGLEIIDYVPDFAYLVRGEPAVFADLDSWSALRWSGPYPAAFRLSTGLTDEALQTVPATDGFYLLRGFPGEPLEPLLRGLAERGARVLEQGADSGGGATLKIGAPAAALLDLANLRAVAWIERAPHWKLMNAVARSNQILRKDLVEQVAGYYGQGEIVAVTDTGLSTGDVNTIHADFQGRVVGAATGGSCAGDWGGHDAHGTHVAGSVLGSGVRSGAHPGAGQYSGSNAGIAPRARLFMWSTCEDFSNLPQTDFYNNYWAQLYGWDHALRSNNNSWGSADSADEGRYNVYSRDTDRFVRNHPDMVAVFSAGNSGTDDDLDGVSDMTTTAPPSTAKNLISVGASESVRASGGFNPGGPCAYYGECWPDNFPVAPLAYDRVSDNPWGMVAFSGRGPTLSGRLKPDIAAPGTNIVSARSEIAPTDSVWGVYDNWYLYEGGTSMSSPLVTGGVAVVREFFRRAFNANPSASLVKAALINAASDMTPGQYGEVFRRPDINQGWGRMDLAATVLFGPGYLPAYYEAFGAAYELHTGEYSEIPIDVEGGSGLWVTLAWLDVAGTEASHGALVNDLDLEVVTPNGTTLYGFAGVVGQQRDRYNNFEGVDIASAAAGTYKIRVKGYNVAIGSQSYSVVVTGNLAISDLIFRNGFE